ncbi:MAG TPA: hypothetical protein VK752_26640 [Bryobacteraceae bacterium]|jgi:hypothetical protein|nr:hypothetical protein [Bryobacteraceae bacterium]
MRQLCILLLIPLLRADELTKKMTARVSEEAEAFQRLAPEVLGEETLHQKAIKPQSRFHPRVGNGAPPPPEWQERTIISEYGFTAFSSADASSLHELRQVTSVDGKKIEDTKKAQQALAKAITATDEARKKQLLKQFEKYGLLGAVTDYGQALLLFTRRNMERYEFNLKASATLNGQSVRVLGYRQIDGPEAVTVIDEKRNDQVKHLRIEGELWVRSDNFVPVRITMVAIQGELPDRVREEASIDYAMSAYGALLPVKTEHRETRGGRVDAENQFSYSNFKKFGASSDIKFDSGDGKPDK